MGAAVRSEHTLVNCSPPPQLRDYAGLKAGNKLLLQRRTNESFEMMEGAGKPFWRVQTSIISLLESSVIDFALWLRLQLCVREPKGHLPERKL